MNGADVVVVGAGIVGLATAYRWLERHRRSRVVVLEKERQIATHQTGHNSGVLHSGIYYRPGSLKASNCREGKRAMEAFCRDQGVAFELCGKVIVAVDDGEVPMLERIFERGQQNGVRCEVISRERLAELEPHANGVRAIHVPETGIVNFRDVSLKLAERIIEWGGQVVTGARVTDLISDGPWMRVESSAGDYRARLVVNCAGLYCDRVTRLSGQHPAARIVPFRGEYYELLPEARHLCRNLIYPVPDPAFPFLGVHFTRMIDGSVECGPNAVLAFAREGYRKRDISLADMWDSLTYKGFLRLALRHWRMGLGEMHRSFRKSAFVRALQRLLPEVRADVLARARAGVRAQAIAPDGSMVDDFVIQQSPQVINVTNAPSPAATAALHIGQMLADLLDQRSA